MKISDNLLRSISTAYTTFTSAQFLIKADILELKEEEIILKSMEVASMVAKLTANPQIETEKKFYSHEITVEEFNKDLPKDRKSNPGVSTVKEFILGNGLVYSPFLYHMYNSITKFKPDRDNMDLLIRSLNTTHTQLTKILALKGGTTTTFNLEDMKAELDSLNNKAEEWHEKAEKAIAKMKETDKCLSKMRETLDDTILDLQMDSFIQHNTDDIQPKFESLYEEMNENIANRIQEALEKQVTTITNKIIKQLETANTQTLQTKTRDTVEKKIETLLSDTEKNLETDIKNLKPSIKANSTLTDILDKVHNLIVEADKLSEDERLNELVDRADKLATSLESININNQAYTELITLDLDSIESYLNPISHTYNDAYKNN